MTQHNHKMDHCFSRKSLHTQFNILEVSDTQASTRLAAMYLTLDVNVLFGREKVRCDNTFSGILAGTAWQTISLSLSGC